MTIRRAIIREATESDFDAMDAVQMLSARSGCSTFYAESQIEAWVGTPYPDRYRRGRERGAEYYLQIRDGVIVSYGGINKSKRMIEALFVDPSHGGQGLGSEMMEHLFGIAREAGIGTLRVESSLNATTFYQRHGFVEYGQGTVPCRGGLEIEAVLMQRDEQVIG